MRSCALHPLEVGSEQIRQYLLYMLEERHLSSAPVNQTLNALRFLYAELYDRPWILAPIPRSRG